MYLKAQLEDPAIKVVYGKLIQSYMEVSGDDENEAKKIMGPIFLGALLKA